MVIDNVYDGIMDMTVGRNVVSVQHIIVFVRMHHFGDKTQGS